MTAAFTGLRRGELIALHWRDVDCAGSVIRVRASYHEGVLSAPKSGKVRSVPMAPDVASALAKLGDRGDQVGDDDLVFVGEGGGYLDGSALRRRYDATIKRAGLRRLRFHDLRHTFGTRMIAKADIRGLAIEQKPGSRPTTCLLAFRSGSPAVGPSPRRWRSSGRSGWLLELAAVPAQLALGRIESCAFRRYSQTFPVSPRERSGRPAACPIR